RSSSCLAAQYFLPSTFRPAHSSSRQPHTRPGQKYAPEKQEFLSAFFVSAPVNDNLPARGGFETLCVSDSVVKPPPSGAGRRCGLGLPRPRNVTIVYGPRRPRRLVFRR